MNSSVTMLYLVVELIFLITIGFYFYYTVNYTRYLINEKCKCSEDMRREFIMWGSIIELFLIIIVFLNAMLLPVLSNCSASVLDNLSNTKKGIKSVLSDPISNLKNSPKSMSKSINNVYKTSKSAFKKMNNNLKK
jgi:predicted PurR-regulated permease PerM